MAQLPVRTDVTRTPGLPKPKSGRPRGRCARITLSGPLIGDLKEIADLMMVECGFKPTLEQVVSALVTAHRRGQR